MGQPVFAVIAETRDAARRAAARAKDVLDIEAAPPVLTPQEAHAKEQYVVPPMHLVRATNEGGARRRSPRRRTGSRAEFDVGGQEQFYLEGQISYAIPKEGRRDACVLLDPASERDAAPGRARAAPACATKCTSSAGAWAAASAARNRNRRSSPASRRSRANELRRPVKLRLDRDDDFMITGRRHCFWYEYEVGYDDEGRILGAEIDMVSRAGHSADLSGPVMTRALCHFDNAYWLPDVSMHGYSGKTNTQSNTAFRGFGGPQGAIAIENILDSDGARDSAATRWMCAASTSTARAKATSRPMARS